MTERYPRLNATTSLDRSMIRQPRKQVLLTGPGSCVTISEIGEEEAVEWDRIVAARGGRLC